MLLVVASDFQQPKRCTDSSWSAEKLFVAASNQLWSNQACFPRYGGGHDLTKVSKRVYQDPQKNELIRLRGSTTLVNVLHADSKSNQFMEDCKQAGRIDGSEPTATSMSKHLEV